MTRIVTVAAAQLGPIARLDTRAQVVQRLLALMRQAKDHGCDLVVFPALAVEGGHSHHFNTAITVDGAGRIVGKYCKIPLPRHREHEPRRAFQQFEKRHFETGNLAFNIFRAFGGILGMAICNARRWPQASRPVKSSLPAARWVMNARTRGAMST